MPDEVNKLTDIPFLPVQLFKTQPVQTGSWAAERVFESSGTTGQVSSKHMIRDLPFMHEVAQRTFERFYGPLTDYVVLALLPSYLERGNASLVDMVAWFIGRSQHPLSGFYLDDMGQLLHTLGRAGTSGRKVLLIGVTFALLDLAESQAPDLSGCVVMETGGMKGRRLELTRAEVHTVLLEKLNLSCVHSEYGMTELSSQAYAKSQGLYHCAPWMRILIREAHDPYHLSASGTGGINIVDLANIDSCAFIETMDIGKKYDNGTFEVLGRFDNSDIRGCSLMVV